MNHPFFILFIKSILHIYIKINFYNPLFYENFIFVILHVLNMIFKIIHVIWEWISYILKNTKSFVNFNACYINVYIIYQINNFIHYNFKLKRKTSTLIIFLVFHLSSSIYFIYFLFFTLCLSILFICMRKKKKNSKDVGVSW
jgi:hypothetical protein